MADKKQGLVEVPADGFRPATRERTPEARPSTREGMGAVVFRGGTSFRVWAPHALSVAVAGDFNGWAKDRHRLAPEGGGYWSTNVDGVGAGSEYRFVLETPAGELWRKDPYGRDVDHSNGNSIIADPAFDWSGDDFKLPPRHELVIYEMHLGTFNDEPGVPPGDLRTAIDRLQHLVELGVNAIQVMPLGEFPGSFSLGYNPADLFAVATEYGGPNGLKAFIKAAHGHGLAVIVDVVYNYLGPSDLDLWQFDGWHENGKGGIYFYNDWRSATPWGDTRPNFARPEVRGFLRDNALFWLEEIRADGLRFDNTAYIRTVHGDPRDPGQELPEGWSFLKWVNARVSAVRPTKVSIAADLHADPLITRDATKGGAGFTSQWAAEFAHSVRSTLAAVQDEQRSIASVRDAILHQYNDDAFQRIIYTESHDEVANGRARVPSEIAPHDPGSWHARKRSALGAMLIFTSPGIPMLFQGQEFLEDEWLRDVDTLEWAKKERYAGIFKMYQYLIRLRRSIDDHTRGLMGLHTNVFHTDENDKIIAFHRWNEGGPGDDVVVIINFADRSYEEYTLIGFPRAGCWRLRFNSDWSIYGEDFGKFLSGDVNVETNGDGPLSADLSIGPYSGLIFSQEPA